MIRSNNLQNIFEEMLSDTDNLSEIKSFLSLSPKPPQYTKFRYAIVFHKGDLSHYIEKNIAKWDLNIVRINKDVPVFRFIEKYGRGKPKETSGLFTIFPGSERNMYRLLTLSKSEFWNHAIEKLLRRLYPGAMQVFFTQNEIRISLKEFQNSLSSKLNLLITEMTMRRKVLSGSQEKKDYIETERHWKDYFLNEAFMQAREGKYWFTSIKFDIKKERSNEEGLTPYSTGRIYKNGKIYYDYLHSEIDQFLLRTLENCASNRLKLLSKRGIRENNYKPTQPLQIEYSNGLFSDISEIKRFGKIISSYPKSTLAVYHSNPYYHASIADYVDGSSVDIWILSPNKIILSPQAKTTENALERLISYIYFEFQEGDLSEYANE